MNKILNKNIKLFYAINFFESLAFFLPIWLIFFTLYLNFSIWTAIFINILTWLVSVLFEINSWSWADRFWRKNIYIVWIILCIFWQSFYLWTDNLYLFILSSIILWIWYSITSGNLEALIHDHLEEEKMINTYELIQDNQYIYLFTSRAIASLLWWYLYILSPTLPFYLSIIAVSVSLILVLLLYEPKQLTSTDSSDIKHIHNWIKYLLNNKKYLYFIFLWWFIFSWIWNIYRFSYQEYLKEIWYFIKEYWMIYFLISIFSALWTYLLKYIRIYFTSFFILRMMIIILFILSLLFINLYNLFWIIPIMILSVIFWFIMSLWNSYLIKEAPKTHKSTILSVFSFSLSLWYFIFSAISGLFIDIFSLNTVYLYIPLLLAWVIFIDFIYFRKKYY